MSIYSSKKGFAPVLFVAGISLFLIVCAVGAYFVFNQKGQEVKPQTTVPVENKISPTGSNDIFQTDPEIIAKLGQFDYKLEQIEPQPCAGLCPKPLPGHEPGAYAVREGNNSFRINLGQTILTPFIDLQNDGYISLVKKIGQDIMFVGRNSIYWVDTKAKVIRSIYKDTAMKPVYSQLVLTPNGKNMISGWAPSEDSQSGKIVEIDLQTKATKTFPFEHQVGEKLKVIDTIRDLKFARSNENLLWPIPGVEPTASPNSYSLNGVGPISYLDAIRFTILHLDSGLVDHKARAETVWGDQPEYSW